MTVLIDDVDRFVADQQHAGRIIGTVDCPALSPDPLEIFDGKFNLMRVDEHTVETKRFDYRFSLGARDGSEYHFSGYKVVRSDASLDLWRDTTRLYIDIAKGAQGQLGRVARGLLEIAPSDFYVQMQTLSGVGGRDAADRAARRRQVRHASSAASCSTPTAACWRARAATTCSTRARSGRCACRSPRSIWCARTTARSCGSRAIKGGNKGPLLLTHGLGVSSLIFSIDTIDTNLLEYLVAAEYDCWLLDYRASVDLPYARELWTADDVRAEGLSRRPSPRCAASPRAPTVQVHRPLLRRDDLHHVHAGRPRRRALRRHLADLDRLCRAVVPAARCSPICARRSCSTLMGIDVVNARATTADPWRERVLDKVVAADRAGAAHRAHA